MRKDSKYGLLKAQLVESLKVLNEEAHDLRGDFKAYAKEQSETRSWSDRSVLTMEVEKTKYPSFSLTWRTYVSTKTNINNKATTRRVNKGRGNSYSIKTLKAHAQPWEIEVVREFEEKAAKIRTEVKCINMALEYLRRAEYAADLRDELNEEPSLAEVLG